MQTLTLAKALESAKNSSLIRNTGWAVSTEAVARISRLLPIIVFANYLSPKEYGIAMLALALHEIFRVFMRSGCGNKIVQCSDSDLKSILQNASFFQWAICTTLSLLQATCAPLIATYFESPSIEPLLTIMAISYLFYPLVAGKAFWMLRNNNLKTYNLFLAACLIIENTASSLLVSLGVGITSVAYAKIISSVAWIILFINQNNHPYGSKFYKSTFLSLGQYSFSVLGIELIRSFRTQLDIIIAGKLLSHDLLGAYCFAKSIGLGISQSLITAYTSSLYPHICTTLRAGNAYTEVFKVIKVTTIVAALFLLQIMTLPFYSALLFDAQWTTHLLATMVLCGAAIPILYMDTLCCFLRAKLKISSEFRITAISTIALLSITFYISPETPLQLAYCIITASCVWIPVYFIDQKLTQNAI